MVLHDRLVLPDEVKRWRPAANISASTYVQVGAALVSLLLAIAAVSRTGERIPDDSYILLRYVQNLLDGQGWVYNLYHPTTNAVSSPLYTLLLALIALPPGSVEAAMTVLFVSTTALSGYLVFTILYRRSMLLGGCAAMLLIIFNPWLLATKGLETSGFVVLILLSILLLDSRKTIALGIVLVASALVRGDGAVIAAVAFVTLYTRDRQMPWRLLIGAAVASICWAVAALILHIPPIPDTLAAKYAQGRSGLWDGMLYLKGSLLTPEVFGFAGWATAALLLGVMGLLFVVVDRSLRTYLGPFILATALIYGAYAFVIRPPSYHWYYGPQLALLALAGGVGVSYVSNAVTSALFRLERPDVNNKPAEMPLSWTGKTRPIQALTVAIAIFLVMVPTISGLRETRSGPDRPEYLEASRWLTANTPQNATVALTEIGVVGWHSKREMVDFLGLLSKDSVNELSRRDYVSWLSREEPDYWIVHQPSWSQMESAVNEPWFPQAYRPVWSNGKLVAWERYRSIKDATQIISNGATR